MPTLWPARLRQIGVGQASWARAICLAPDPGRMDGTHHWHQTKTKRLVSVRWPRRPLPEDGCIV